MLQMSCVGDPSEDPEFWCLYETLKSYRKYHIPEIAHPVVYQLSQGAVTSPGPCHATLRAIHKVGWQWEANGRCIDQNGLPIHIINAPLQELYIRTKQAWQTKVFSDVEQARDTMHGLSKADATKTTAAMTKHDDDSQGLLRCVLNAFLMEPYMLMMPFIMQAKQRQKIVAFVEHRIQYCIDMDLVHFFKTYGNLLSCNMKIVLVKLMNAQ